VYGSLKRVLNINTLQIKDVILIMQGIFKECVFNLNDTIVYYYHRENDFIFIIDELNEFLTYARLSSMTPIIFQ